MNIKDLLRKMMIYLPDKVYLSLMCRVKIGYWPNWKHPVKFNEKIQVLKLLHKSEHYERFVDKYTVRQYIEETIGGEYLIPNYGVFSSVDDVPDSFFTEEYVLKTTHDSGGVCFPKKGDSTHNKLCREKLRRHLRTSYFAHGREYPYKNIEPRIVVEKFITDNFTSQYPTDYKFFCYGGEPKYLFITSDRHTQEGLKIDFYDLGWNKLPVKRHYENSKNLAAKPVNFDTMITLAQKLSKPFEFIRVDLYSINNKIYFSELTFYPGSGFEEFTPKEFDIFFGDGIRMGFK